MSIKEHCNSLRPNLYTSHFSTILNTIIHVNVNHVHLPIHSYQTPTSVTFFLIETSQFVTSLSLPKRNQEVRMFCIPLLQPLTLPNLDVVHIVCCRQYDTNPPLVLPYITNKLTKIMIDKTIEEHILSHAHHFFH